MKDLKGKIKEKNAEIEVLKEMVKSANMQVKAKDVDLDRLKKRMNRRAGGGVNNDDNSSAYGSRRGRDDRSSSSRHSRIGQRNNDFAG